MQGNEPLQIRPMTKDEYVIRQSLAISALNEALVTSWVEHQPWCAFTQAGQDCTCGTAINVWFSGPTRLVGVGYDMQPLVIDKH